jgi:TonB family protein
MASPRFVRRLIASGIAVLAAANALAANAIVPPRILQTTEAQFPPSLSLSPIYRGFAEVIINIDADGKLADSLVSRYSRVEFAHEAVRALRAWRYEPARLDGQALGVRFRVKFDFSAHGKVASLTVFDTIEMRLSPSVHSATDLICSPHDLDRVPTAVATVAPRHPGLIDGATHDERVVLDYLIDDTGRPRMPVVIEAAHGEFADQAVAALNQWRFTPPTRDGRPVVVQVRQQFIFKQGT